MSSASTPRDGRDEAGGQRRAAELERLFVRVAGGDAEAMTQMFEMERARLTRMFLGLSGCAAAAEDLVQTTFLDLWRYRRNYRGGRAPAYLYRAAIHAWRRDAARMLRRRATWGRFARDFDEERPSEAEGELRSKELDGRLRAAVDALPAEQREVFVLHRLEGLACPRIAEVTGANVKTVESRLRLAVGKLAERLLRGGEVR